MMKPFSHFLLPCSFAILLSACGGSNTDDVRQWMDQTRAQSRALVKPLSEPKKFSPYIYDAKGREDPYSPNKLAIALAKAGKGSGIQPNFDRRSEPLESYPLDMLSMVGTLSKPGMRYALIQVDKTIYQVKVGNYIGKNIGLVTNITDTEVHLKETVQDAAGEWVEREAKLELQEMQK
ncbi:MAG: pilus assembly protein PilP [Oxalicibacterium faecigallinarum]|uniref:Pilus assembly protein PilP n=1 Tax=Oxalicibacterium faecigallinarum TaxID=573741 RepID=A0A8J3F353_9BURK|nr:pilus assembly protein PilP [Oxalicibacterium faecigallinarum]MDQ7968591.1 pilus assembly protein PilP [Oxalicibacterium faecigallinarum]GGI19576.1 pilus assembly protein PilP [Oxalicibacterium faecigallinarum]